MLQQHFKQWHGLCIRDGINQLLQQMKTNSLSTENFESTYALIVRSEEKERGLFEGAAYLVFILSAIFSIWNLGKQPIELPKDGVIHTTSIVHSITIDQA